MRKVLQRALRWLGRKVIKPLTAFSKRKKHQIQVNEADIRCSPVVKVALVDLMANLREKAVSGQSLPPFCDCGFRIFSQFEEDGYLAYLAATLELTPKLFVDIGAADGVNSNCANLAINLGWHGLFIDGDCDAIERGAQYYAAHADTNLFPPLFRQSFVTAENVNGVIGAAGFTGQIGCLSIDVDGNDCWIWNALEVVQPAVVVIESHIELGEKNLAVPYDSSFVYPGEHPDYFGASAPAMVALGAKKGYRLVGANRYGFNLFFVRDEIHPDRVPTVSVESVLTHPRHIERLPRGKAMSGRPFVSL